ncbi:MAG: methyltransferase domain-containing protein [Verrucomicrobia bacterium]|nr:methyltransferase domain-containing protein [Verrucomicrobiota bacterium]
MTLKQQIGKWLFAHLPITRFLFDQIRLELNALLVWLLNHFSPKQRARLRRIRNGDGLRVNVACGPHIEPGCINLDLFAASPEVVRWDCRRRLPLRNSSALGIRAEHFLEHLEVCEELPSFLADCLRVLKPGGVLRIIVPDAQKYIEAYLNPDLTGFAALGFTVPLPEELPTKMDVVNHVFHQHHEHRCGYDFENLRHRLETAGFVQTVRMAYGKSSNATLACDRPVHAPYSIYVEAFKPDARNLTVVENTKEPLPAGNQLGNPKS